MQSASWFASPDTDPAEAKLRPDAELPRRRPRRSNSKLPAPPPDLDDEQIASALEDMESGEVLGSLPERPARATPPSTPPAILSAAAASGAAAEEVPAWTKAPPPPPRAPVMSHSTTAVTQPPHPSSIFADLPVPVPEALPDEAPEERDETPEPEIALRPGPEGWVTDPGLPRFEAEVSTAAADTVAPEAGVQSALPSDVIPPEFRVEPGVRSAVESRYEPPLAPLPAERTNSRFIDLEHSEPPTSARELESSWFSDLGVGPASSDTAALDDGPAWTLDREASLADTLVRPAQELPELPAPRAESIPEFDARSEAEFAAEFEAVALEPAIFEDSPVVAEERDVDSVQVSSPMIDVFRRSAIMAAAPRDSDVHDSAFPVPEANPEPESREGRVIRARVASIGSRALAWLIDGLFLSGTVAALGFGAAKVAGSSLGPISVLRDPLVAAGLLGLAAVVGAVYAAVGALIGGQTFGARLARVRVLDRSGHPPALSRALLRGVYASVGTLCFLIGLVWVVVDDRGQALHDKLAKTYVVRA